MISGGREQSLDYFLGALNEAHSILAGSDETSASHSTPSPAPTSHSTPSPAPASQSTPSPATRPFFSPPTFVYPPPASVDPPSPIDHPPPVTVAPPAPATDPSVPAPDSTQLTSVYVRSKRKKKT